MEGLRLGAESRLRDLPNSFILLLIGEMTKDIRVIKSVTKTYFLLKRAQIEIEVILKAE